MLRASFNFSKRLSSLYVLSLGQIQVCKILGGALLYVLEALKVSKKETNARLEVSIGELYLNMIYVCCVVLCLGLAIRNK
jgi:hypothetical protein